MMTQLHLIIHYRNQLTFYNIINFVGSKLDSTFVSKLEILILFILNGHRVVKRGVYFLRLTNAINGFL